MLEMDRIIYPNRPRSQALRPQCPASAGGTKGEVSFETKQKQRQEEIDSLKMALDMLKQ